LGSANGTLPCSRARFGRQAKPLAASLLPLMNIGLCACAGPTC
jgi:hypothetical protein